MTAKKVKSYREKLGLSVPKFAELVGVHESTAYRWERGDVGVPEPTARMIRMLADKKESAA